MEKIDNNRAPHFMECKVCGSRITERTEEVWANVPDDEIEFAVADNKRAADEAATQWEKDVEEFKKEHFVCDPSGFNF